MKFFSAGYINTNNNFVFQNIKELDNKASDQYLSGLFVIKNILQRGNPTKISRYLADQLNIKVENGKLPEIDESRIPLISSKKPDWQRVIKGDTKKNNFPAQKFFDNIPTYLGKGYEYVQNLLCPEVKINEITQVMVDEFEEQQVDFYLPQAFLVIEIDGHDPLTGQHGTNDKQRDDFLRKYGIKTIRIDTNDIDNNTHTFKKKIDEIKDYIDKIKDRINEKYSNQVKISLSDYQKYFDTGYDFNDKRLIVSAIIRLELLIISLIENGDLEFDKIWKLDILLQEGLDSIFVKYAIEDLLLWLENIYKLENIDFKVPKYEYNIIDKNKNKFSIRKGVINIDFSILERYTDENQVEKDIIFVRNNYFDYFQRFDDPKNPNREKREFVNYDYFSLSTTIPFTYHITDTNKSALEFFLKNITGYESLNDGQYPIIQNILERKDTIGLLPTGSGKSLCFHLACLLQPAINFVVCPIKSLMYDQVQELIGFGINRVASITSDFKQKEKELIQIDFSKSKYFIVFISPERFQTKKFRDYIARIENISYAIIDEMHCLSEWGHDFRTSYLCLAKTIRTYCPGVNFLGLTATASANVLKDIKNELSIISDENIKTLTEFNRPELEFVVVDDGGDKYKSLVEQYKRMNFKDNMAGIIFTPYVNGKRGCYSLANKLAKDLQFDIRWYSGGCPQDKTFFGEKSFNNPIMDGDSFDKYKIEVQKDFKENKFSLMTATKAFGMGINKKNIAYTFHYGIPTSMEALYQEGGRAGRDKKIFTSNSKANCFVLLGKESRTTDIDKVFDITVKYEDIVEEIDTRFKKKDGNDIFTQLFLWKNGLLAIDDEAKNILDIYKILRDNGNVEQTIENKSTNKSDDENSNSDIEKTLYRLMLLGVIDDYTIAPGRSWKSKFEVVYNNVNENIIKKNLESYIMKYDSGGLGIMKYKEILEKDISQIEKYIRILLQRSYDHHAYSRRQSLKNLYLDCIRVTNGEISNEDFKRNLESYFRFDNDTYIIQDIADNIDNINKWSQIFYQTKDITLNDGRQERKRTDNLLGESGLNSLKSMLGRFLESYQANIGLNLISGILRLLLNEYEDLDGRKRLEIVFDWLKEKDLSTQKRIINQILTIAINLTTTNKNKLIESMINKVDLNKEWLIIIYNKLQDEKSLNRFLEILNNKLLSSYKELDDKFTKFR